MPISAVIFDFNGTLFWDTHLHRQAWDIYLNIHGIRLSDQDRQKIFHGKSNQDIYTALYKHKARSGDVESLITEKEGIYQKLCLQSKLDLAPGAASLLDFLNLKQIPFCIASSSGLENIEFYMKYLDLGRWFDLSRIVYNDGTLQGKPAPDVFLKAFGLLNAQPQDVLIFEDSISGLIAAKKARSGKVIIVNSHGLKYSWFNYPRITHFDQVDRGMFFPT
ncbi:MAG: HAD family phosphatase [Spirochaetales bacterium]|nr:HAD family phosphatase [Spirochaetales bacterium]